MSILLAIVIGIAVGGGLGYLLVNSIDHLVVNSVFGMAGSILGIGLAWISGNLGDTASLFSLRATLSSIICAAIFVLTFTGIQKILPKAVNNVAPDKTEEPHEEA